MPNDEAAISPLMQAAVHAAAAVHGRTSPNPWVGAVLVSADGAVLATGATAPDGGPHAEAIALQRAVPPGSTLYVTLEPCAPFAGKRTRPCAERIIEAGVARVVVALLDPDPRVAGNGVALLRAAGIDVTVGDGADLVARQLRPYLKQRQTGTPYVIAKFACSLDGRTSANTGDSKWITGEAAREAVHDARARADAIVVGSGTVLADDPALTARPAGNLADPQPLRVVLDGRGRIPAAARVLHEPGDALVVTSAAAPVAWRRAIAETGATVVDSPVEATGLLSLHALLETLAARGVLTVWVEGGATLLGSLFDDELVDEVWAFVAPSIIGGRGNPAVSGRGVDYVAQAHRLRDTVVDVFGADILVRGFTGPWEYTPAR